MILLLESLHPDAERLLEAVGDVRRLARPGDPPGELRDVRAILTRGRGRISDELLARCPALEVIARAGAGLDNLDTRAAAQRGVPVIFAPGANASTVAEHTLALMLDVARGMSLWSRRTRSGAWETRGEYKGVELRGLTLGVLGLGRIGARVAVLANAFGMDVLAARFPGREGASREGITQLPFDAVLAQADVLSIHLPLNDGTRGIVGAAEFARMRDGVLIVNTARGELIDGGALRAALASGKVGGFAADVLDIEPPPVDDPLLRDERVVLTPHVASLTSATYRDLCLLTAENVARVLRGESPDPRCVFSAPPTAPT